MEWHVCVYIYINICNVMQCNAIQCNVMYVCIRACKYIYIHMHMTCVCVYVFVYSYLVC